MAIQQSWLGRIYDYVGCNRRFAAYSESNIDKGEQVIISPCDACIVDQKIIKGDGMVATKHGRQVAINKLIDNVSQREGYQAITMYLAPIDRHFFVAPCSGSVTNVRYNQGTALIPWAMAWEHIGIPVWKRVIESNASVAITIQHKQQQLGLIAVGSLNVNRIELQINKGDKIKKGEQIGNFLLGSAILLLLPVEREVVVAREQKMTIGQQMAILG